MPRVALVAYVVLMVALIITVDVAFLRDRFWPRLATNVGIVLVFGIGYWLVGRH